MDSPEIVFKSTLPPDLAENFMAEMTGYLETDNFTKLVDQADFYAHRTADALLKGDVGNALGWARLYIAAIVNLIVATVALFGV